jgi:hypothetical protein
LQEALVQKRTHASQITTAKRQEQLAAANEVRLKMIKKILPDVTEDEFKLHNSLFLREFTPTAEFFKSVENWFDKLIKANRQSGFYYTEEALKEVLIGMWLQILKASGSGILTGLYYFLKAPFSPYMKIRIIMEKIWEKLAQISF